MTIEAPPVWLQGGTYPARLDRFLIAQTFDEGVMRTNACKVSQRGAGANFTVDVAVGEFVVQGDDQALQGNYLGRVTAIESATIGSAPAGSNKRIDLVTLRINDPNAGGNAGNTATVVVVAGTQTTGTPVAPALPASSIPLATVGPILSSTASITNAIITDARLLAGPRAPVGELRLYAPTVSINGWLACNGQAVSRTTYADLFTALGTSFGVGDGSSTFNLPDLRDRVAVAAGGTFATVGATGGEINHVLTTSELAAHNHAVTDPGHTHDPIAAGSGGLIVPGSGFSQTGSGAVAIKTDDLSTNTTGVTTQNNGGGGGHNNMQPYQVVSGWMIRA